MSRLRSARTSRSLESSSSSRRAWAWRRWLSSELPKSLPAIEKLADEFGVNVALSGSPKTVLEAIQARGRRIGAYADLRKWTQEGIAPLDGIALLNDRLLALKLTDRNALGAAHGRNLPAGVEAFAHHRRHERWTGCRGRFVAVVGSLRKSRPAGGGGARDAALSWDSYQGTRSVDARGTGKDHGSDSAKTCGDAEGIQEAADLRREHRLRRREWRTSFDPGGKHGDRAVRENRRL